MVPEMPSSESILSSVATKMLLSTWWMRAPPISSVCIAFGASTSCTDEGENTHCLSRLTGRQTYSRVYSAQHTLTAMDEPTRALRLLSLAIALACHVCSNSNARCSNRHNLLDRAALCALAAAEVRRRLLRIYSVTAAQRSAAQRTFATTGSCFPPGPSSVVAPSIKAQKFLPNRLSTCAQPNRQSQCTCAHAISTVRACALW